jgi:DNA alkylation repair enzyme
MTSGSDTAAAFVRRLADLHAGAAGGGRRVPMREIFALAKVFVAMPPEQIEELLDRPDHESRVGAVSIMDFQARDRRTTEYRRRELYELYVRRHDRIDNWTWSTAPRRMSSAGI